MVEFIVSFFILSITMVGMTNLFVSANRYTRHSRCRIQAANTLRYFLDNLQMNVRQDQWNESQSDYNNFLSKGEKSLDTKWLGDPPIGFTPVYNITVPPGFAVTDPMRKVKLQINWTEPAYWTY